MAKQNSALSELRVTVARQEKSVAAKIARTKKNTGAVVAGTEFDVRRAKGKTRSYNSTQLKAYSEQLSGFMDRNKQFTVSTSGHTMRAGAARLYKVLETRFNKQVNDELEAVAHLMLPRGEKGDGDILNRMQEMVSDRMSRANPVNVSYKPPVRDVRSITSEEAMKTLTDDYRKRLTPKFQAERLAKDRESFLNSLREAGMDYSSRSGEESLVDLLGKLSDKQFSVVWKYSSLAGTAFLNYESMKNSFTGKGDVLSDSDIDDAFVEVRELLTWAQMLTPEDMSIREETKIRVGKKKK